MNSSLLILIGALLISLIVSTTAHADVQVAYVCDSYGRCQNVTIVTQDADEGVYHGSGASNSTVDGVYHGD